MKQGYVTIPRKPRIPSWNPSVYSTMSEFPPATANSMINGEIIEPVYDNLGLRTTVGGNSVRNLNKIGQQPQQQSPTKYSMKDRPLPATPSIVANSQEQIKLYEPIPETPQSTDAATSQFPNDNSESRYGISPNMKPVINATGEVATKEPPRPPPKPKKRTPTANDWINLSEDIVGANNSEATLTMEQNNSSSTSKQFEDEGEDGTEV